MTNETKNEDTVVGVRHVGSHSAYGDASIIRELSGGVPKELTDLLETLDGEKCPDPSVV